MNSRTLKKYGFTAIEEYFDYILESKWNGQHTQAHELFNELSEGMQGERAQFFEYLEESLGVYADAFRELKKYFTG